MSRMTFLQKPTLSQLYQAVAENHHYRRVRIAESEGGRLYRKYGLNLIHRPNPDSIEISFPRLPRADASQAIDAAIRFCRRRWTLDGLYCWSLSPSKPPELGALLAARGFLRNFRPRWMWLDMSKMKTHHSRPRELKVELVKDDVIWDVDDLPYYHPEDAINWRKTNSANPRRIWRFVARLNGEIAGQSMVSLTTGKLGIACIFDVGVRPAFRNRGIGKAVTIAACEHARDLDCQHAMLTGTGETMYRQIGFEVVGYGQTWICREGLKSRLPTKIQIAFYEAIGMGDINTLDTLARHMKSETLSRPLPGGMSPIQLAVEMNQSASIKWLVQRLNA